MVKNKEQLLREVPLTISKEPEFGRRRGRNSSAIYLRVVVLLLTTLLWVGAASAQLNIPVVRGDNGLKSASQPGPGIYVSGIYYFYDTNTLVDRNGTRINRVGITQTFAGLGVTGVFKKKILGGNYSATIVLPVLTAAITTPQQAKDTNTGIGYSDTYAQPINLGWHKKKYDAMAWYGIYAPTGSFTAGATNNHGLGMWSHEFGGGATVYFDEKKTWHAATVATYNVQSHIRGTNRKAGNVVSLEGGVGKSFCSGLCNVGVDYYTQWKVTDDTLPQVPPDFIAKHRYYGLGGEVNGVIPISAKTLTIFKVAFFHELGNRVGTQGNSVILSFVLAKPKG